MDEADPVADVADEEWPPRANRLQAIRWRADGQFERGEFFAAACTLAEAFELVGPGEGEVFRGLHHLAAAGYRHQTGESQRAAQQLAHARRRLSSFPDVDEHVRAVERLLAS
jgi:hypothetical protein